MSTGHLVTDFHKRLLLAGTDADRLALHMECLPAMVETWPAEALVMANEANRLIPRLAAWTAEPELLRHRAAAQLRLGNATSAGADLEIAYQRYAEEGERVGMAGISILLANIELHAGNPAACGELLARAMAEAEQGTPQVRADALDAMGQFKLATSDYAGAIEYLRAALALCEPIGDHGRTGRALSAIGTAFARLNDLDAAYQHHAESLDAFRRAGDAHNQIRTMANLASVSLEQGLLQKALERAAEAHALCLVHNDLSVAASMRMMMGDIHNRRNESDLALEHYLNAYQLLEQHPTDELLLALYHRIGSIHQAASDPDAARHVFAQALGIAERIGDRRMAAQFHEGLAMALEALGEYRDALVQCRRFVALREEIAGEDRRRAMADLQARYEREMLERERTRAEQETAELKAENESQREELTEALRNLARSNAALEKLKANLRHLQGTGGNKAMAGIWDEINRDISVTQKADHEWKQIERTMDKLHPGFAKRLFDTCPQLTRTEMKICMLTRLGHTTAAIAETLDNESRTVQTQRLKIRKKFNLAGDVDFMAFIANL